MDVRLDRSDGTPLYRQIVEQVLDRIRTGSLSPGTHLPPERKLAVMLGVNRTTVVTAYRDLVATGLVEARVGHDTGQMPGWVARGLAYVPVALFAALAVPGCARPQGTLAVGPELAAGAVAALVAWRTGGRTYWVLAAGLGTYAVARLAVG